MKHRFLSFIFFLLIPTVLFGQAQTAKDQNHDSGTGKSLLQMFKLSGSIQERWEATDGPFSMTPANSYVVSQIRLGALFRLSDWLSFYAEAQDVRALFYQVSPSNTVSNPFDLHQAWIKAGQAEGPGFFLKVGRQDMVIGSGHLLAATDEWWPSTARNFDVARGSYTTSFF